MGGIELWRAGPTMGKQEGSWPLKVDKAVVVQAGTTQRVWVKWPALENDEFQTLSNLGITCFHIKGSKMGGKPAQLARGVAPLRKVLEARSRQRLLFNNSSEHNVVLMPNDIIGHANLVARGQYNQQWL